MRLFLSEYICSGALSEKELPPSLLMEGRAMRDAIINDLDSIPGVSVVTTCDARLAPPPCGTSIRVESSMEERLVFEKLARDCDASYVIAPEDDGLLLERCQIAASCSARTLNCQQSAIQTASDKLELANILSRAGIPTIPTVAFRLADGAHFELDKVSEFNLVKSDGRQESSVVIKPRYGAGSQDTYLCRTVEEIDEFTKVFMNQESQLEAILQPYIAGRNLSVAAIFDRWSNRLEHIFPVAEQTLSTDGRFRYSGGRVPAVPRKQSAVASLLRKTYEKLPGLHGYVGFDLLEPYDGSDLLLVEVNPRLTTSYVGYRRLARSNLAHAILEPACSSHITWKDGRVTFSASGQVMD